MEGLVSIGNLALFGSGTIFIIISTDNGYPKILSPIDMVELHLVWFWHFGEGTNAKER